MVYIKFLFIEKKKKKRKNRCFTLSYNPVYSLGCNDNSLSIKSIEYQAQKELSLMVSFLIFLFPLMCDEFVNNNDLYYRITKPIIQLKNGRIQYICLILDNCSRGGKEFTSESTK